MFQVVFFTHVHRVCLFLSPNVSPEISLETHGLLMILLHGSFQKLFLRFLHEFYLRFSSEIFPKISIKLIQEFLLKLSWDFFQKQQFLKKCLRWFLREFVIIFLQVLFRNFEVYWIMVMMLIRSIRNGHKNHGQFPTIGYVLLKLKYGPSANFPS